MGMRDCLTSKHKPISYNISMCSSVTHTSLSSWMHSKFFNPHGRTEALVTCAFGSWYNKKNVCQIHYNQSLTFDNEMNDIKS